MSVKTPLLRTGIIVLALMFAAIALAYVLKPTRMLADIRPPFDLEAVIPKAFGDWRVDETSLIILPSPDTQAALDKIYNQTLARSYINNRGQRVMLSIAYGGDQSDAMQVHMPEGCYQGQGFAIKDKSREVLQTLFGELPVSRLVAYQGQRNEPITYWILVGEEIARTTWEMKLIKLRYATRGLIPEGLLFRVSNITPNTHEGYAIQQEFAEAMIAAMPPESRARLIGKAE